MTEDFNINERMHLANEQFTADMKKADSWQKSYGDLVKSPEYLEMRTALDEHGVKGLEPLSLNTGLLQSITQRTTM